MDFLKELGIDKENYGACIGGEDWIKSKDSKNNDSINPATGEVIATLYQASEADYEKVMAAAEETFKEWKKVPAPIRGQLVREIADALREKKDALGSLVSLEMGKIKQEGDGEVQEMIDIADFAVGQSRMLYGKTMHSERQDHRMYEQWHPLGILGVITAFNFPVAVWAWNACLAAICGDVTIWKPSSSTPLCAVAIQNICNNVLNEHGYKGIFNLKLIPVLSTPRSGTNCLINYLYKLSYFLQETTNVFVSEGTIPFGNWTLNTTDTGFDPVINQSVITLTDAGDIALEDSTDSSSGFIILNGTDSSSTNAGSQFDLETATLKDVIANAI